VLAQTFRVYVVRGPRLVPVPAPEGDAPHWSPDGELLEFAVLDDIAVVRRDGANFHIVRRDAVFDAWSPDGRWVLFDSLDDALEVMRSDGSGARHIVDLYSDLRSQAVWSPDGRRVAFQNCSHPSSQGCDVGLDLDVYVAPVAGGPPRRITRIEGSDQCRLAWAPGPAIAYGTTNDTGVAGADGSVQRVVRGLTCASWSPDGMRLLGWTRDGPGVAGPGDRRARPVVR
jgi:Tol biopolymer transport system component